MGTRNLTVVVLDGEYKVAQYGQWDGYPSGQGETVCKFIRGELGGRSELQIFKTSVKNCRFLTDEQVKEKWVEAGANPNDEFVNGDVSGKFKALNPMLSRDTGAEALFWIKNGATDLHDSIDFAADSLFCEFAYVVDLDNETLEVYKGFNKRPLAAKDRFYNLQKEGGRGSVSGSYYPVIEIARYKFSELNENTMHELEQKLHEDEESDD